MTRAFVVERLWPLGLSKATLRVDASRDTQHNNAVAIKDYLQTKIRRQLRSGKSFVPTCRLSIIQRKAVEAYPYAGLMNFHLLLEGCFDRELRICDLTNRLLATMEQ
jgi:hypothetical protein